MGSKLVKKYRIIIYVVCITLLFQFFVLDASASWLGPQEIVKGLWGSETGQFFFSSVGTFDTFPKDFFLDNNNRLFINDGAGNRRIQIFSSAGVFLKKISPPSNVDVSFDWPNDIYVHSSGNFVASFEGPQKFLYDSNGNFIKQIDVYGKAYPVTNGYIFCVSKTEYPFYSFDGQLLKTYTERPPELGSHSSKKVSGVYQHEIKYPGKTFTFSIPFGLLKKYMVDSQGDLCVVALTDSSDIVYKINNNGEIISQLKLPETVYGEPIIAGVERFPTYIAQYGDAVIAPNGDVYTWKRTPDNYSVIKWTWQDSP